MAGSALTPQGSTRRWRVIRAAVLAAATACHWCGDPPTTVDHIVPRARGGGDTPSNLVASGAPCNPARANGATDAPPSRAW